MKSPLRFHRKAEPGLEHVILVGDVMAEMAEGLFDPAGIQRVQPAELQPVIAARPRQRFEDMRRLIGGDVELPAQLADIGDAVRAGEAHADLDLARGAEGMRRVGEIVGLTACISRSRAFGPITQSTASPAVTSVITTKRSPRWRRSQARSRCSVAPGTTSRKAVSDSRVTVRSLRSRRARSASGCRRSGPATSISLAQQTLQEGAGVGPSTRILPKEDMSNRPTPSRTAMCSARWLSNQFCRCQS
jgi:hypothetical protein